MYCGDETGGIVVDVGSANARFLNPRLLYAQGTTGVAATETRGSSIGPAFIQIGTEGEWVDQRFVVVGRIAYGWARGKWNEWH